MITAALITFAVLALAWLFAPSDRRAAPEVGTMTQEPLAEPA